MVRRIVLRSFVVLSVLCASWFTVHHSTGKEVLLARPPPPNIHTQHILTALLSPFANSLTFSTRLNYEESMQDEEAVL